ncbi:protein-tyrosine phosphatase family protein [Chondromyces apiculatus]|uniref:Dual specificity protein phosphatase n=1 Tax=Chondromyces apiculatus DSM 436 TaxID=1192034 RepID=A0A017T2I3_9BACT|nr:dual specificity protein phosphatase family protein [Chondromyces apiculatus]EYF03197.1 dual specificity protein phosphatase [Chondromyces apiculatus DSM 436]
MVELNLSWITSELAVGGSFPESLAEALAREHGVRAVVDLRAEERDDEALLVQHGMTFLHLPTADHGAIGLPMLEDGVGFVNRHLDRGEKVLIHCAWGIGRSATLALCVLVSRGMAPLAALELAKSRRSHVSPSPAQFACWSAWMRANGHGEAVPHFDAFKAIAYRHLLG